VSAPAFWQGLYQAGDDGWELGGPAPPLWAWLEGGGGFPAAGPAGRARIAVPGCGRGHDTRLLARHGYRVWGFDFAPAALAEARRLAARDGIAVTLEQRDVFTLAGDYASFFDAVWEYTCFCAIDPARREEYVRLVHALLRPGGVLLACFYPLREGTDGPPFPVSRAGIERALAPWFDIAESGPPAVSVDRRRGLEWLVRAERRERAEAPERPSAPRAHRA
jgi:SAM-dependent methyltransferase